MSNNAFSKRNNYLFLLLIAFVFILQSKSQAENGNLRLGYIEVHPYFFTNNNNNPDGVVLKKVSKALEKMDFSWQAKPYPPFRLKKNLSLGITDISLGPKDIKDNYNFYGSKSIGTIDISIISLRKQVDLINNLSDLKGKTFILIKGYDYGKLGKYVRNNKNKISFFEANSHKSALKMLISNRADYLINYKKPMKKEINTLNIKKYNSKTFDKLNFYVSISKKIPNAKLILNTLEKNIDTIK